MNREDVAMDLTFENLDLLRKEVHAAKLLLSECDEIFSEEGISNIELRGYLSGKLSADEVIELLASQQGEPCKSCKGMKQVCVEPYPFESYEDCPACAKKHPEQAEGTQGGDWLTLAHEVEALAHRYWKAAVRERGPGAVQWLHNEETGALFIFTRGEYADDLKEMLWKLPDCYGRPRAALAQPSPKCAHGDWTACALCDALPATQEQPSPRKSQVAEALRVADWSNTCIGNKALILAAIEQLEAQPSPAPELGRREVVAWALQRKSDGFVRATWHQKPSETQYEIAELDGDVIAPLYAANAPKGFALVPIEPTVAMRLPWKTMRGHSWYSKYKAMLAAATVQGGEL